MKYDVNEIKDLLDLDTAMMIVKELGGEPKETNFGFISRTICHNKAHEGKHKLYYYKNTKLFKCYTGCDEDLFDIFDLLCKIKDIEKFEAILEVAHKINYIPNLGYNKKDDIEDFSILDRYEELNNLEYKAIEEIELPEYDSAILDRLSYPIISPWLKEGISLEVLKHNRIGFFPVDNQITIPHYDKYNRFIGLRGRTLSEFDAETKGKYRPVYANKTLFNHPLGLNLYNLNNSKDNVSICKKAIVFESEKACLLYQTLLGQENDISVACCGFNISPYQIRLLTDLKVDEIVIAFDRQFQTIGDNEYNQLLKKFKDISNKYSKYVNISFLFDRYKLLKYKSSPIDEGLEKFMMLYNKRIKEF